MAVALNWRHTRIRFARRHALQIVDEPHTERPRKRRFLLPINVNGHGAARVQSIRPHHQDIPAENDDRPKGHWPVRDAMAPDIALALSSFATVGRVPVI